MTLMHGIFSKEIVSRSRKQPKSTAYAFERARNYYMRETRTTIFKKEE